LVGLGAGFFGGIQYRNYQINKARSSFVAGGASGASGSGAFQRFTRTGSGTGAGARTGGGAVTGSILSVDVIHSLLSLRTAAARLFFSQPQLRIQTPFQQLRTILRLAAT